MTSGNDKEKRLSELPLTAEDTGFKRSEMIVCGECGRPGPPNRVHCLYCGAEQVLTRAQMRSVTPVLQKIESWEPGHNIIWLPGAEAIGGDVTSEIAEMLGCDTALVAEIFETGRPMPLLRTKSRPEADSVCVRLSESGVRTQVVSDERLMGDGAPTRLRGLDLKSGGIIPIPFNPEAGRVTSASKVELLVVGSVFRKQVDSMEKGSRNSEDRVLETAEFMTDRMIVDLYLKNDAGGYRVRTDGFDFSCLGDAKQMLASENIVLLVGKLRNSFPDCVYNGEYDDLRHILGLIWQIDESKSSKGLKRKSFGGFLKQKQVTTDSERQFTLYSRLQGLLPDLRDLS